jgi:hypothetical protein
MTPHNGTGSTIPPLDASQQATARCLSPCASMTGRNRETSERKDEMNIPGDKPVATCIVDAIRLLKQADRQWSDTDNYASLIRETLNQARAEIDAALARVNVHIED